MTDNNKNYESSDLQALGDLEAIRERPGMYLGDTYHPGHVYTEILDNSGDEAFAGYCSRIVASVDTKNNTYSIRDYGRGIPIGTTQFTDITGTVHELESLQLMFTKTHSGGKFNDTGAYKISRGMHGVGLKIVNAVSIVSKAITYRNGKYVQLIMSQGDIKSLTRGDAPDEPNGVYVEFSPDKEIFTTDIIPMEHILQITGISKAFGVPVELYVDDEQVSLPYNELYDLLPPVGKDETVFMRQQFEITDPEGKGEYIRGAFEYTSETNSLFRGYTNMIPNPGGGSHIRFLEDCYRLSWEKYLDSEFRLSDVMVGFRGLSAVFISNKEMAFAGQTKERLTTNKSYFNKFKDSMIKEFQKYFDDNPKIRNGLIKRFKEYRAAQNKLLASKEISSLITVNEEDTATTGIVRRRSVVAKLRECTSKSRKHTKLWINEGDSAAGCFTGDTLIRLANGTSIRIDELVSRLNNDEEFYTYSSASDGTISVERIEAGSLTIKDANLVRVTLDNGESIRCTPDHPFLLRSGTYEQAQNLAVGTSLMPLRTQLSDLPWSPHHGNNRIHYEFIYDNQLMDWVATHSLVASSYLGNRPCSHGYAIHHKDFDSLNNYPTNLEYMRTTDHKSLHLKHSWSDPEYREVHLARLKSYGESPANIDRLVSTHRELMRTNPEYAAKVTHRINEYWKDPANRELQSYRTKEYYEDHPDVMKQISTSVKNTWIVSSIQACSKILAGGIDLNSETYQYYRDTHKLSHSTLKWQTLIKKVGSFDKLLISAINYNHKVVKVEVLSDTEDVYDIQVGPHHNFSLGAGVFVHNTVIAARNIKYDAVLPLRGKIKNTARLLVTEALKSEEVRNIVNSIGAGVGDNCDATKSRYEEINLVCDADPDGKNIAALVTCTMVHECPDILRAGMFYISEPPLYGWKRKKAVTIDGHMYNYEFTNDVNAIPKGVKYSRYKGLGEMSEDEFYESVMSPLASKIRVDMPDDIELFDEIMTSSAIKYQALIDLGLVYTIDNV